MLIKRFSFLLCFLLSGCMGMNKKFDCPLESGITCKSVAAVNDLVDAGLLPNKNSDKETPIPCFLSKSTVLKTHTPKTLTVWFAPIDGGLENASYRTLVLDESEVSP